MKCDICGAEVESGSIYPGYGLACSKDCEQIIQGRIKASDDALLAEPLDQMPEKLETQDFERWAHKLALHLLNEMSESDKARLKENNRILQHPSYMALELKELILRHIPSCYVSETEARGHDRLFYGGTYCFRQPVPKEVIYRACQKAEILK